MKRSFRLLTATAAALVLAGCATTTHYYSASNYTPVKVGDARVTTGVSVGVSPSGVSVTPRVRYYYPRRKPQ